MMQFMKDSMLTATAAGGGSGWDIGNFLKNSFTTLGEWFSLATMLLGIVAVVYSIFQIVSGLMSHGKKQVNWAIMIVLLLVGGMLSVSGGFKFVQEIAKGGTKTIKDLGGQTITVFDMFLPFM